jgi:hypothetical protein
VGWYLCLCDSSGAKHGGIHGDNDLETSGRIVKEVQRLVIVILGVVKHGHVLLQRRCALVD